MIWPKLFTLFRATIMSARLLVVHGRVQTDGKVIHVVADRLEDATDRLERLSTTALPPTTTRGDHPTHPLPAQVGAANAQPGGGHRHPRDVRVIPKSRDFH